MMANRRRMFDWNSASCCASAPSSIWMKLPISARIESIRRLPWPLPTVASDGGHVVVAAQLDDLRQFRHFGIHQWSQRVQVLLGSADQR